MEDKKRVNLNADIEAVNYLLNWARIRQSLTVPMSAREVRMLDALKEAKRYLNEG